MKVAVIGKGQAGKALGSGLERAGYEIRYGHRDLNEKPQVAAEWGEMTILAVPYHQLDNVVEGIGSLLRGKIVIDVTNPYGLDGKPIAYSNTSGAEKLQRKLPESKVVKAFNTVLARNQSTGHIGEEQLTGFVAGDDAEAKKAVMDLMTAMGFDPVDSGSLKSAKYLEEMGLHIVDLAFGKGMGPSIGYRLIKK
jgi:predicted dinucleotide-binding enzyme